MPASVRQSRLFLRDAAPLQTRLRAYRAAFLPVFWRSKHWKGQTRRVRLAGCLRAMLTHDSFSQRMPQVGRLVTLQKGND